MGFIPQSLQIINETNILSENIEENNKKLLKKDMIILLGVTLSL